MVRITVGYDDKGKQIFKILGYAKNRKQGLEMLAAYHKDPNAVDNNTTFTEVYEMLLKKKEDQVSAGAFRAYQAAYKAVPKLHKMKMSEIKLFHLQSAMDELDSSSATKLKYKTLYTMMFELAIQHDIVTKNYAKYIEVGKSESKTTKEVYTDEEIEKLWKHQGNECVDVTLVLLYTGMRIGEFLSLKMENIHLDEQYVVGGSKTEAGKNRTIALADKIMPVMRRLYGDGSKKALVVAPTTLEPITPQGFKYYWKQAMSELGIERGVHETRHTCITNLYKVGASPEVIRKQVGHSGKGVTEQVYLHLGLPELLEAVNKLK